jgi:hypothetical protein
MSAEQMRDTRTWSVRRGPAIRANPHSRRYPSIRAARSLVCGEETRNENRGICCERIPAGVQSLALS